MCIRDRLSTELSTHVEVHTFQSLASGRLTPSYVKLTVHRIDVCLLGAESLAAVEPVEQFCDAAVGIGVARRLRRVDETIVTLATAHPAKFPDAVEQATGVRPPLPSHLADLYERTERVTDLPNDLATIEDFVDSVRRR